MPKPHDITVCIATIPPRARRLRQALGSVAIQTLQPGAIVVEYDHDRTGAAATKNRALAKVTTDWVTFLDDDDILKPNHLERLREEVEPYDVAYSWPEMQGSGDPSPDRFGRPFDANLLRVRSYLHTNILVRTKLAQEAGGFQFGPTGELDDWGFHLALLDAGAGFIHVPERTWVWVVEGQNTSGKGDRW